MISKRRLRDTPTLHVARCLAQQLALARIELPAGSRVCIRCSHVFTPTFATDMRCDGCARDAAAAEAVRL